MIVMPMQGHHGQFPSVNSHPLSDSSTAPHADTASASPVSELSALSDLCNESRGFKRKDLHLRSLRDRRRCVARNAVTLLLPELVYSCLQLTCAVLLTYRRHFLVASIKGTSSIR